MKVTNLLIGISMLLLPLKIFSQEVATLTATFTYDIEFIFTGQVNNGFDSVFTVNYVFNLSDLQSVSKLILKIDSNEKQYPLDGEIKEEGIKELNGKLYLDIGIINPSNQLPLVEVTDSVGNLYQVNIIDKSGDNYFPIKDTFNTDTISEEIKHYDIKPN